jgi:Carboxypeptidase regulatory-like domain/TonB dependent receptor-like, beta-barrel
MRSPGTLFLVAIGVAVATVSYAQQTTGTMKGYVKDEQGLAVPGVTITLTSDSLMGSQTAVADTKGFYRVSSLPPGLYRVEAELAGFGHFAKQNVRVEVGVTTPLDIVLKVAGLEEVVTVSVAAPVVETERTEQQFIVNSSAIQVLPVAPRLTYQGLWQLLPGVTGGDTDYLGNELGDPRVNSAFQQNEGDDERFQNDAYENNIFIDGMDANDPMSGKSTTNLSYEVIDEVNVKTAGFEAQYGTGRSATMQVVTKSGGNDFSGSALFQFQPESWNATNVEGGSSQQLSYYNPALTLGGPIRKDKLWFFASWKYDWENVTYPDTQVVDKLAKERRGNLWYGKLTYQLNPANRMSFSFGYDRTDIRNGAGDARRSTVDAMTTQERGGPLVSFRWNSTLSSTAMFDLQAGYNSKPVRNVAQGTGPRLRYYDSYRGSLVRVEGNDYRNYDSDRESLYFHPSLSWFPEGDFGGRHEIKFGTELRPRQKITRAYIYNVLPGSPGIYEMRFGLDPETYGLSEPYLYEVSQVDPVGPYNHITVQSYAGYVQDRWHPTPKLTINAGLRWEKQIHTTKNRGQLPASLEIFDPNIRDDVEFDDSGFAPRFGIAYDFGEHGVLRGSAGRFFERVGTGDYNNYPAGQGFATYRVPVSQLGEGLDAIQIFTSPTPAAYPAFDRGMKMEYNDEFTVGYERALPGNFAIDTTFIYRDIVVSESADANVIFNADGTFSRIDPAYDRVNRREFLTGDQKVRDVTFKSIQISLRRNFTNRAGLLASFSRYWTKMDFLRFEPTETEQFAYASPDALDMTNYGPRWNFKASAYYLFPGDIALSTFFNAVSGEWVNDISGDYAWNADAPRVVLPNGRTVSDIIWEARNFFWAGGAWGLNGRNTDTVYSLNIRGQKNIKVGGDKRLELSIDLYNAFNWAAYTGFESADIRNPFYPNQINPQRPRAVQGNVRFVF